MTSSELIDLKNTVKDHEEFINGTPNTDGAKTRLKLAEYKLARIDKMVWAVIAMAVTVIGTILTWFFTSVLPHAASMSAVLASIRK